MNSSFTLSTGSFQGLVARATPDFFHLGLVAEVRDGMKVEIDGATGKE